MSALPAMIDRFNSAAGLSPALYSLLLHPLPFIHIRSDHFPDLSDPRTTSGPDAVPEISGSINSCYRATCSPASPSCSSCEHLFLARSFALSFSLTHSLTHSNFLPLASVVSCPSACSIATIFRICLTASSAACLRSKICVFLQSNKALSCVPEGQKGQCKSCLFFPFSREQATQN
jgi:hypothetical protein